MNEAAYRQAEKMLWQSVGIEPDEKCIILPSTGTAVRVQVVGEGPPVLFIHGGPNAGTTWAPIVGAFDGYTCLIVDRPGAGLSQACPQLCDNRTLLRFAHRFVEEVLVEMGLEKADVVASSFGGFLALHSAAASPERFGRMVQMACPALVPGMVMPTFMRLTTRAWFRRITGLFPPNQRVGDSILRQIGHGASLDAGRIPQSFKDWYLELQRHTDTVKNYGEMIGSLGRGSRIHPELILSQDLLGSVGTSTLFLWGYDDGFGGEGVARGVTDLMPDARLEMIPESGHLPWLDFPAEIGARTRTFLDGGA